MVEYIINKEKNTVVALLKGTEYDAIEKIEKLVNSGHKIDGNVFINYRHSAKYIMPNKFVGIAKCSPEDTWDENFGKNMAREKLLKQYNESLNKRIYWFLDDFLYIADRVADYLEREERKHD